MCQSGTWADRDISALYVWRGSSYEAAMSDHQDPPADSAQGPAASRRRVLQLGAIGAATVISVRPALAQTAVSVMTCEIPVPDPSRASQYVAADGSLVAPGTPGAVPGAAMPFKGEDVRNVMTHGGRLPGTTAEQNEAYVNYIRRLRSGTGGFTCFASIQMPR